MKNYLIYFEVYSKKMKTYVPARSETEAKEILHSKLIIHKVQEVPPNDDFLTDFFNKLNKK